MDTLAHIVYGVTYCSRAGLAGGREGVRGPMLREPTFWLAAGFGLLPDGLSLGLPFLMNLAAGAGRFFSGVTENDLRVYRALHNLVVPTGVGLLLWFFARRAFVPFLAWPLHVLMDAISHGPGKFQTRLFHPLWDWGFPGLNWWQHPWIPWTCWLLLPPVWMGLWLWRRRGDPPRP